MKLFALSLAFTLSTAVGNGQTYDTSADFGTFNPAVSVTTPAYTLNGNTVVLKVLCGAIHSPVTAVSFGSQALTRATQVSNLGTVDVWYLVGATTGSAPFIITTDGTSQISVQAYSAANVSALSGAPVTNTTNLGNAPLSTQVTARAGNLLVLLSNATDPFHSSCNIRQMGVGDRVAVDGQNTITTEIDGQGNSYGNAIAVLTFTRGAPLGSISLAVNVVATTPTQAILAYTAPDSSACQVRISESSTFAPLDHDVDPVLFPGSDQDNRAGALSVGTKRIFVAGTRDTETGSDGVNYSRALQQNTQHWYSVTCGAVTASGTFTTAIAPLGSTYRDLPYLDKNGHTIIPTITDDANQRIIEPHLGTLIKKMDTATQVRNGNDWPSLYSGGAIRMCAAHPIGPDPHGYLCAFAAGTGPLFYVHSDTGIANQLGGIFIIPNSDPVNGWSDNRGLGLPQISADGHIYAITGSNSGKVIMLQGTYTGNYQETPASQPANITWVNMTPGSNDLYGQMTAFDPTFNPANYAPYDPTQVQGSYTLLHLRRGVQDSAGWLAIFDTHSAKIVAMLNAENGSYISYCGLHTSGIMADQPIAQLSFHGLWGTSSWQGPFQAQLTTAIGPSDTVLQLAGPNLVAPNGQTLGPPVPGTIMTFDNDGGEPGELIQVVSVNTSNSTMTVNRNYIPHLIWPWQNVNDHQPRAHNPQSMTAQCTNANWGGDGGGPYWQFLIDPHGQNVNSSMIWAVGSGVQGHDDSAAYQSGAFHVGEGWLASAGPLTSTLLSPATTVQISPYFATSAGGCNATGCSQHPSYHTVQAPYFTDGLPWNGGGFLINNVTLISGNLYFYPFPYGNGNFPPPQRDIHRKQVPTRATTGGTPLLDVSGPSSSISDQATDNYKYCVAYVAGECRPGSNKGDMFVNVPALDRMTCYGSDNPNPTIRDACITDMPAYGNGMVQIGFTPNHEGLGLLPGQPDPYDSSIIGSGYGRVVTEGLGGPKYTGERFKTLPDGSWGFFELYGSPYIMMAKMPPFVKDSVHRDYFVRSPLNLTPPAGLGVASAAVEFWYAETNNGACTSRNEACVVTSPTVDDTNPFAWKTTDTWTPAPCASRCTITLPVAPSHVAYYHVKYLDANGNQVAEDFGVSAEATVRSFLQ